MNHYEDKDHKQICDKIKSIEKVKWIVSYDNVEMIKKLYSGYPCKEFSFKHTAYESRDGQEILFMSKNLILLILLIGTLYILKVENIKVELR